MDLDDVREDIPSQVREILSGSIKEFRPAQEKAIHAGLLKGKNVLVCTPTASGKTIIAELAMLKNILEKKGKALYLVPLKALATEKHKDFKRRYGKVATVAVSIGNLDSADPHLASYDLIICTAEKLDSLLRHHAPWLQQVRTLVVDEVHLLNDPERGPTLEILITMLKQIIPSLQVVALSATIGNPQELAAWLDAELVIDTWRPVTLMKGTYLDGKIEFKED